MHFVFDQLETEISEDAFLPVGAMNALRREALEKLIAQSDVFLTNWRQPALERAALDYESLKAKYPKLVYGIVSGYGEKGPDKDLPGFDFTAYFAHSGVMGTLYDRDSEPMLPLAGFGDHQVAMSLASGVIAALYRAEKTGRLEDDIAERHKQFRSGDRTPPAAADNSGEEDK